MGTLTGYLQREFAGRCPRGWVARGEVPVLSRELAQLFGYAPHADVLLEREDGSRRLWIEFEVSRADPVANHAKFATAHLFQPQLSSDSFVAMVSPHVARGRRNLAADMPGTPFPEVGPEIERAFAVAEPVTSSGEHRIHLAGDVLDALLNVRRWNEEIAGAGGGR